MWIVAIILLIQVAVLVAAAYAGRSKLKRLVNDAKNEVETHESVVLDDMSEIDKSILTLLRERQGVAYQSEIIKELGLPKSTVHKALRRLSEAGYVEIQKRGRFNVVVLKKTSTSEASAT